MKKFQGYHVRKKSLILKKWLDKGLRGSVGNIEFISSNGHTESTPAYGIISLGKDLGACWTAIACRRTHRNR